MHKKEYIQIIILYLGNVQRIREKLGDWMMSWEEKNNVCLCVDFNKKTKCFYHLLAYDWQTDILIHTNFITRLNIAVKFK